MDHETSETQPSRVRQIIKEWRKSTKPAESFADERGLKLARLKVWAQVFGESGQPGARGQPKTRETSPRTVGFVEMPDLPKDQGALVELEVRGGRRLSFDVGVDVAWLGKWVRALEV